MNSRRDGIGRSPGTPSARRQFTRRWLVAACAAVTVLFAAAVAPAAASAPGHVSGPAATGSVAQGVPATDEATESGRDCSRRCMTRMVDDVLDSMLAHNPATLPLAQIYRATENSHPAALGMMTLWRTLTKAGKPDLLAIDTTNGQAYFALNVSEGNNRTQAVLWGRIRVVAKQITELELYINRSRGDHGFTFSSEELSANYQRWMSPPDNRQRATRTTLQSLSEAAFDPSSTFQVSIAPDCQFTEVGGLVIDPGPDGTGPTHPLGCNFPPERPADANARDNLVIDEELGIVVVGALVPGKVYPYGDISAFIPNDMAFAQEAQDEWLAKALAQGRTGLLAPTAATGETLQVLQYYNGQLQGLQINLYLSGPGMQSAWTQ